jgi:hypothetical protein
MAWSARDLRLAAKARANGARYSLRILDEARRAGIPASLGFALVQTESGFKNIFGHDPTIFVGAGAVTKDKYLRYKALRGHTRMQGVGLTQLTWWATQDEADKRGGCWVPRVQLRVAFEHLAALIKQFGPVEGIARYNGSGPAARRYSQLVRERADEWHRILT